MDNKKQTIDCTPSWVGVLPILLHGLENDDPKSRDIAKKELFRMAQIADAYVELVKK